MAGGEVVVLGSAVVDLLFRVAALPLPGENAVAHAVQRHLGGKGANQAVAARRLGAPTRFVGAVGDDEGGRETTGDLERAGVELALKVCEGIPTGLAAVLVDDAAENLLAVHLGANLSLEEEDLHAVADRLRAASVFVAGLEVPIPAVLAAVGHTDDEEQVRVLNAAPFQAGVRDLFPSFDVVVVNRGEAEQLTEVGVATVDDALAALRAMRDQGARDPVITLGAAGAVCFDRGRGLHVRSPRVEAVDATGAGDAFVGALAALHREEWDLADAVEGACRYAALSTTRLGARAGYPDREAFLASAAQEEGGA